MVFIEYPWTHDKQPLSMGTESTAQPSGAHTWPS